MACTYPEKAMRLSRCVPILALVCAPALAQPQTATATDALEVDTSQVIREIDIDLIDLDRLREAVEGQPGREPLRLTLEECVHLALAHNQEILVIEYDAIKSDADIFSAKGEFDPVFGVNVSYLEAVQQLPPEYRLFGGLSATEAYRTQAAATLSGKLQTGALYNLQFDLSEDQNTYNAFREERTGNLTLTMSQPILRGRGKTVNRARIRMAECAQGASEEQLRVVVMQTVAEVVKAYWDLVGAVESVRVRSESLANAERLLETSAKRLDIGTAAAIEVLQAKAGVAMRQSDLIAARSTVRDAEDMLKTLLDMRDDGVFSNKRLVPVDRPEIETLDIDQLRKGNESVAHSIDLALKHRPEIALAQIEIDTGELELMRAEDNLKPELNVTGAVTQGGRDEAWHEMLAGVRDRNDHSWTLGIEASVPIGNRAARGAHERARQTLRQSEQRLTKTKQELMLKVRMAARAVDTSRILVESNRQSRRLQETNVVAEEKRLRLGLSTSYRVLQIQEDLTAAQVQEVQAQTAHEKALVELRLAEGVILDELGIAFDPPPPASPIAYGESIRPDGVRSRP
ncbi:MAG TPA: TolC family protein [Candidatus Hydrogenedentes bacterium]|nr:TolC family protein [Candidatus Hydrogenedentota bacterium]